MVLRRGRLALAGATLLAATLGLTAVAHATDPVIAGAGNIACQSTSPYFNAGLGTPTGSFRAGDEVRLEYANGAKVTAIGTDVTIQGRERRSFIGAANWLHTARNKHGWKYVADVYAVLLLYLAISGIFMIKGRLGLKWRGALLITVGVAVPIAAVMLSGPDARATKPPAAESAPAAPAKPDDGGIKFLPPDQQP